MSDNGDVARRSLLKLDEGAVMAAVDSLNLRASAKVSAVVGVPLRQLQQRRDVASFAATAPILAVKALLEVLALEPLEKMIDALGEHAESPTYEQLCDAVDALLAGGTSSNDVVAVLGFALSESFPAAAHCRRLFEEREAFALPTLPVVAPSATIVSPKMVDPEVRAQRRARREAASQKKRAKAPSHPPHAKRPKVDERAPSRPAPQPVLSPEPTPRRPLSLTALERARFDDAHPLVASVVLIDVPFDGTDPETPEVGSKERPALVVAATGDQLLVRPLFSGPSVTRRVFGPWRRVGLDHLSYLDDARIVVELESVTRRLGVVTDVEWNALL